MSKLRKRQQINNYSKFRISLMVIQYYRNVQVGLYTYLRNILVAITNLSEGAIDFPLKRSQKADKLIFRERDVKHGRQFLRSTIKWVPTNKLKQLHSHHCIQRII